MILIDLNPQDIIRRIDADPELKFERVSVTMVVPALTSGSSMAIRSVRGGGVVAETVQTEFNWNNQSDSSNLNGKKFGGSQSKFGTKE